MTRDCSSRGLRPRIREGSAKSRLSTQPHKQHTQEAGSAVQLQATLAQHHPALGYAPEPDAKDPAWHRLQLPSPGVSSTDVSMSRATYTGYRASRSDIKPCRIRATLAQSVVRPLCAAALQPIDAPACSTSAGRSSAADQPSAFATTPSSRSPDLPTTSRRSRLTALGSDRRPRTRA
jgi:hypothetical protein